MKNTRYILKSITPCADCTGRGIVTHPAWGAYWAWNDHYRSGNYGRQPSRDTEAVWWEETGYSHANLPPKEYDCPTCHGTGKIETDVDLQTALANINYPVPNHNH